MMIIFLAIFFLGGFLITVFNYRPRVKLGRDYIYCNPRARIKTDRIYQLRLWDTHWPVLETDVYQAYLERMIRDFQIQYPNIKVQITLVDLFDGPNQLAAALKTNSAPDVYCSAFAIPAFNLKQQIPVGFYLKQEEKEAYFPEARRLVMLHGVECYFPRWLAPTVWIGNQYLCERLNLPVFDMQQSGYSWNEIMTGGKKLPEGRFVLVGNLGHNGLFTDLTVNAATEPGPAVDFLPRSGMVESLNHLNDLVMSKKIPGDFESNMLGRFLAGDSLLLAGVRPIIYRFLKLKLAESPGKERCKPILLPSPGSGRKKVMLTENGVICVYRNKFNSGDDRITAAVKLGQFISTYERTGPFQELMLIPAARKSAGRWSRELAPVVGDVSGLLKQVEHSSLLNLPDYATYQKEVYPVLQEFLTRKVPLATVQNRLENVKW